MKTRDEVEKLKQNWLHDPCYDIEEIEGYEDYKDELLTFRKKQEGEWAGKARKRHEELASKFCPMSFGSPTEIEDYHCLVEKCAWWQVDKERCVVMGLASLETIAGRTGYAMQP